MDTHTFTASSTIGTVGDALPETVLPAPPVPGKPLLEWSAPVHAHHERTTRWYVLGSVAVLAFAAYGILTGAWTLTLLALLLGGLYFLVRQAPISLKHIALHERGFVFDALYTPWTDCQDFWLIHCPGYNELHILKKRGLDRTITIHLPPEIEVNEILSLLSQYLPHRADQKESLVDMFIRICKL